MTVLSLVAFQLGGGVAASPLATPMALALATKQPFLPAQICFADKTKLFSEQRHDSVQ